MLLLLVLVFFFFNDTATTEIYTLSLHDALPISSRSSTATGRWWATSSGSPTWPRSEEHTSELQSHLNLVCRLLLEKKTKYTDMPPSDDWRSPLQAINGPVWPR